MENYFEKLHAAEFGNDVDGTEANPREFVKLLKRALTWKTLSNLQDVCLYLGADESDKPVDSVEDCKAFIESTIKFCERNEVI